MYLGTDDELQRQSMSYCRWSDDDHQCECDVYVYETASCFITHVARLRAHWKRPLPPPIQGEGDERVQVWLDRHKTVRAMFDRGDAEYRQIGLPHDGESFEDATASECADRLEQLKSMGYNVPQYAIDELREEAREPQA